MKSELHGTRVLILGPLPPPFGGPEVITQGLLSGLAKWPRLQMRHINTQVSRSLAEKGGKHQLRKSIRGMAQSLLLVAEILRYRPDVVYLPLTNSPSFAGFVRDCLLIGPAMLLGRRVAVGLLGGFYYYVHTTGWKRWLVAAVLSRVAVATVEGERLKGVYNGFVQDDRIVVVPNGADPEPFAAAALRAGNGIDRSVVRVLFVGLMCHGKGFREVIAAVPRVANAQFICVGEWPSQEDRAEVESFLATAGVRDRVTFTGVVSGNAKYDIFASADLFVFPSYFTYEGHAVASVEAIASGLPIVCTDHGALNESVEDGCNGFFVPQKDVNTLVTRIQQLVDDENLRRAMGSRSRERFEQRYTLKHYVGKWADAMERCAARSV